MNRPPCIRRPLDRYNVYEAKLQLSRLLARVESGEEIHICRAGRPIARLVPNIPDDVRSPGRAALVIRADRDLDRGVHTLEQLRDGS